MTFQMTKHDQRHSNGITVTLLWNPSTNDLAVHVLDEPAQEEFELSCAPHQAARVFHHPYAYAASRSDHHPDHFALER